MADRKVEDRTRWPRIREEGADWEARVVPGPGQTTPAPEGGGEVLEFVCLSDARKTRRLAVRPDSIQAMTPESLHRAFVQARPIGGDHYGRPGKRMSDTA